MMSHGRRSVRVRAEHPRSHVCRITQWTVWQVHCRVMPSLLLRSGLMDSRGRGGHYSGQWDEAALTWPLDDHMEMEVGYWEYWTAPKGVGMSGKSLLWGV